MKQSINVKHVLIVLAAWVLIFGCQRDVGAGAVAPGFKLPNLKGEPVTLEQHRGSVVLLDFWATWCPPCRKSIPELVTIQKKYREDGLVILGLSMDDPKYASDDYLKAFKEKMSINYTILRADRQVVTDYFSQSSPAIPTLFVVDREGKIRSRIVGYRPGAVEKALSELLD